MCGKIGTQQQSQWKFFCGRLGVRTAFKYMDEIFHNRTVNKVCRCKKNEPFTFKVDLGRKKQKKGKRKNTRRRM